MDIISLLKIPTVRKVSAKMKALLFINILTILAPIIVIIGIYISNTKSFKINYHVKKHFAEITGEVTDAWVEKQPNENQDVVFGYEYAFSNKELGEYKGISYGEKIYPIGQKLKVRYDVFYPHYSIAAGLRSSPNTPIHWSVVGLIFLAALTFLIVGFILAIERWLYMERGVIAIAQLHNRKEYTEEMRTEDERKYNNMYHYIDNNGKDRYFAKIESDGVRRTVLILYLQESADRLKTPHKWSSLTLLPTKFIDLLKKELSD